VLHDSLVGFQPGASSAAPEGGSSRRDHYRTMLMVRRLAKQEETRQGFAQGFETDSPACVEGQVRDQQELVLQVLVPGWDHPKVPQVGTRRFLALKCLRSDGFLQVIGLHLEREQPHHILLAVQIVEHVQRQDQLCLPLIVHGRVQDEDLVH
jgi:hypothetical protein